MTDLTNAFDISYTQINNNYLISNSNSNCSNQFGNYFSKCSSPSAQWGSPTEENDISVSTNEQTCHKLFNNSTKRKSIVFYNRSN